MVTYTTVFMQFLCESMNNDQWWNSLAAMQGAPGKNLSRVVNWSGPTLNNMKVSNKIVISLINAYCSYLNRQLENTLVMDCKSVQ